MLLLYTGAPAIQLTADEVTNLAEADGGEFAANENICAIFARHPNTVDDRVDGREVVILGIRHASRQPMP